MANLVYNRFKKNIADGTIDFDAAGTVVRCLLERSTSTYSPNADDDFVGDLTGLVEITVASYARQTVASKAVNQDDTNDRAELDFDDLAFGNLESGQTVKALIFYVQTGGSDATPNDDILIARVDTDAGAILPVALAGGAFNVAVNAEGFLQLT